MFRTSKILLAGAVVAFAASAAQAQSNNDLLAGLMASAGAAKSGGEADAGTELRNAITQKIMQIATTSQSVTEKSGVVTIAELDELNRTAERAKTELELERLELERLKTELDSLMALYETIKAIEGDTGENRRDDREFDVGNNGAPTQVAAAPQQPSDWEAENDGLPRVTGIVGVSGNYMAELEMPDGSSYEVRKGDFLDEGYDIVEIKQNFVLLKGHATGSEYRLGPRSTPAPKAPEFGNMGPNEAIDLGQMPLGIF